MKYNYYATVCLLFSETFEMKNFVFSFVYLRIGYLVKKKNRQTKKLTETAENDE